MPIDLALLTAAHVLVLVYWLGGDLGAFYSSHFLTRPDVPAAQRLLAAKIVGDVDMAPRSALILAFPTGIAVALAKGWIDGPAWWGWLAFGVGLAWLALAWRLHLAHGGAPQALRTLDLAIRWLLLVGLTGTGAAALAGAIALPLFISLKLILLALATAMGLAIRRVLTPLGPALAGLNGSDAAGAEASLAATLNRARPLVLVIWAILITATLLGLWTPTSF